MKNINKKLVFVSLIASLAIFLVPGISNAAAPTITTDLVSNINNISVDLNATVNPNGLATTVWFEFQGQNINVPGSQNGSVPVTVSAPLTGLTCGTNYSYNSAAINNDGPSAPGGSISFSTAACPPPAQPAIVTTGSASPLGQNTATLNGNVNPNGGGDTSVSFELDGNIVTLPGCSPTITSTQAQDVSCPVFGLASGSPHTFRVTAVNNGGPSMGSAVDFITQSSGGGGGGGGAPIITNGSASPLGQNTATLNGNVNPNGGGDTSVSFELDGNIVTLPGCSPMITSTQAQDVSCPVIGLASGSPHTFRVTAVNNNGASIGNPLVNFTTTISGGGGGGGAPIITNGSASPLGQNTATLNGNVNPNGGGSTSVSFELDGNIVTLPGCSPTITSTQAQDVSCSVFGLASGSPHTFRVTAVNNNGASIGNPLVNFTTLSAPGNNGGGGGGGSSGGGSSGGSISTKPSVVTSLSSTVGQTTAKINGLVLNSSANTKAWFEYGTTVALGKTTTLKNIANATSTPISEVLNGLTPNTIYFFRAIAKNTAGEVKGEIKIFRTLSTSVSPVIITATNTNISGTGTGTLPNGNNAQNMVSLKIEGNPTKIGQGDNIDYKVTFKNISKSTLKDVIVKIALPDAVELINSTIGNTPGEDNTLTLEVGNLAQGREEVIDIAGRVGRDISDDDILVATASIAYTDPNGNQADAIDYALTDVDLGGNNLVAASIFGNGKWLPKTLVGWTILILIILALIALGRKLYLEVNWASILSQFRKDIMNKPEPEPEPEPTSRIEPPMPPSNLPQ